MKAKGKSPGLVREGRDGRLDAGRTRCVYWSTGRASLFQTKINKGYKVIGLCTAYKPFKLKIRY